MRNILLVADGGLYFKLLTKISKKLRLSDLESIFASDITFHCLKDLILNNPFPPSIVPCQFDIKLLIANR